MGKDSSNEALETPKYVTAYSLPFRTKSTLSYIYEIISITLQRFGKKEKMK